LARSKIYNPTYISSILSVSLVLFLLGLLAVTLFQAKKLSDHFKENIEVSIFLKDDVAIEKAKSFELDLAGKPYTRKVNYISKEDAALEFSDEFDVNILDHNPLPASVNLYLNAKYAHQDSLSTIIPQLESNSIVSEVAYQKGIVELMNANISKIGTGLMIASLLFLLIAFTLIDGAIRLSMYAKRFLIKSMQLVGATNRFIISPFVQRGILNGLLSSIVAIAMLLGLYYYFTRKYPGLFSQQEFSFFSLVILGVIIAGIIISLISTYAAVKKYLKTKVEDLY